MKLDVEAFNGQHCETTATGTLLNQIGIKLSEPMLFGLGEGLHFIYWNMKSFDFPFLGGRIKPDILTRNIANNLHLELDVKETTSKERAWKRVQDFIDEGIPVGLKLDCFHLEYFTHPFHFAGHYVAIFGYDDKDAHLIDTAQQGGIVQTSLESLALARAEKGPMSSRNLSYTISTGSTTFDLSASILQAIQNNVTAYLNPPISNVSYRGIEKTAKEVVKWFDRSQDIESEFRTSATLMEKAGTGGALFRNLYRDFLAEAAALTKRLELKQAHQDFAVIASKWSEVIATFERIAETKSRIHVDAAANLFRELSVLEKEAMEKLANINAEIQPAK